jgi:6-phosphofructokinase 1
MDRARAVRLTMKCMAFIEQQAAAIKEDPHIAKVRGHESSTVITVQGSAIVFTQVQEMLKHADLKNRRGKTQWWQGFKDLAEALGGRTAMVQDEP